MMVDVEMWKMDRENEADVGIKKDDGDEFGGGGGDGGNLGF